MGSNLFNWLKQPINNDFYPLEIGYFNLPVFTV